MANLESEFIKKASEAFIEATIPTITSISALPNSKNGQIISTTWTQNNNVTLKKTHFSSFYSLNDEKLEKVSTFPVENPSVLLEAISSSNKWKAVIRKEHNKTTKKEDEVLEIWSKDEMKLVKSLNLSSFDKHGNICFDIIFSSLSWSPDEQKLLYVAEKKQEKSYGFFEKCPNDVINEIQLGTKYIYEESWGELLYNTINPVICVADISKDTINVFSNSDMIMMEGISPSQPQWSSNNSIIFSGIKNLPFRLGRIYCGNRLCDLYKLTVNDENKTDLVNLTSSTNPASNTCPRLNSINSTVVFLHRDLLNSGDAHQSSEKLGIYNFDKNTFVFLDLTYEGSKLVLYSHMLPKSVWLSDGFHIAIPTTKRGKTFVCIINTLTGEVCNLIECSYLFGVNGDYIFSSVIKLDSEMETLKIIKVNKEGIPDIITEDIVGNSSLTVSHITDDHGVVSYSMLPKPGTIKFPVIVWAHGGPHSIFTNNHNAIAVAFCNLGYAVLLVNYRGSTSFGDESLMSLPGNIGSQDVKDVQATVLKFIDSFQDMIDKNNIFYYGGSHGGFLGAHLVCKYPDFYRAAVLRNPVIDIASMAMVSDIPDWTYFESGLSYTQATIPNADDYKQMLDKSPIIHLHNIKAPILICIGEKDARVPPSQGKGFYRLLKANNKTTKLLLYPNASHPLKSVDIAGNFFVNTCKWFDTYKNNK